MFTYWLDAIMQDPRWQQFYLKGGERVTFIVNRVAVSPAPGVAQS